ncbi:hypothetical protein DCC81_18635 [Chitinophaga parva]|uniref:Uncharacterized protein n=1 Tax=Chitinophaga parva TaxID=2169414 RepID=A0A2T7BJ14_9BACT|nr:polysaccharide biosynthesis/export family protein [Chitinophaga parva]PUZ26242.1 hypothetical protein DCC81_18635 [Chitinophaga parva]
MKFFSWGTHAFAKAKGVVFIRTTIIIAVVFSMVACSSAKRMGYFQDVPDSLTSKAVAQAVYKSPTVQVDDILQITVQTLDPGATMAINQPNSASWPLAGSGAASGTPGGGTGAAVVPNTGSAVSGFLVDHDGNIELPLVGKVQVKDKTTDEVRELVRQKAAQFYKDPVVNVRLANFKITVLGEVNRPSTYIMPSEKVTLLDALGMAGDMTIYGRRENVMVIREENGQKQFARFDLNNSNLFTSPFYYLKQGDVVYVEPNKQKVTGTDVSAVRRISIITAVTTLAIVLLTRIK